MAVAPAAKRKRLSPPESSHPKVSSATSVLHPAATEDFLARAAAWNLEQDYEQRPRKQRKGEEKNTRLPIKTAEGVVEQLHVPQVKKEEENNWLGSDDDSEPGEQEALVHEHIKEENKVPLRQQILEAKEELARIASLINENPEEHAGGFRTLNQIACSSNPTIKKLAFATQLAVFKDAIPGYRIRPIAEVDQTE